MRCSAPLVGINSPTLYRDPRSGELRYRTNTVLSRDIFLDRYKVRDVNFYDSKSDQVICTKQIRGDDIFTGRYQFYDAKGNVIYPYPVPCGTCMSCRLRRSAEWADRMTCEVMSSPSPSWFLTLTYDDSHVPVNDSFTAYTLSHEDADSFITNMEQWCFRRNIKPRHYLAGEYGSTTLRPHYHAILFNIDLLDIEPIGHNWRGDVFYRSATVERWWSYRKHLRGFVCIAPCSWETCAYTARYVTKKAYGKNADFYEKADLVSEFQKVSNRPGIGFEYFSNNREKIFTDNKLYLPNGRLSPVPAYFDRKYQDYLCSLDDDAECLRLSEIYLNSKKERAELARQSFVDKMHVLQCSEAEYFSGIVDLQKKVNFSLKRELDKIL